MSRPAPPLRIPAPDPGALEAPEAPASEAQVEVVLRSESLQEAVDRQLPNPLHREDSRRLRAEAERGELRIEPGQGGLLWTLPVELWAQARLGPLRFSCGVNEPRPRVLVRWRTELRIDDEWNLGTETIPGEREWSRPCQVSFLNIDVTSMIDSHVAEAQARAARRIDQEASRLDLRSALEKLWPMLSFPVELEREGAATDRLRLLLQPQSLRVAELTGDASELRLRVAVLGRFLATSRFVSSPARALPPPGEEEAGPFRLHLELRRDLAAVVDSLREHLTDRRIELPQGGVARVVGLEGRLTPAGLAIGLRLDGAHTGIAWMVATPIHRDGALRLSAPRWTPATLAALVDADEDEPAVWASTFFPRVEQWSSPLPELAEVRERALAGLRAIQVPEGVSITAELAEEAQGGSVFGEGETLIIRVPATGTLRVTIDAGLVAEDLGPTS